MIDEVIETIIATGYLQAIMLSRRRFQYCKVIVVTSLFWFLLDVLLLVYYTDCATDNLCVRNDIHKKSANLLERILPKGLIKSSPSGPGEMGLPVLLTGEKADEGKRLFNLNQFNLMASQMVSVNRSLPDYRSQTCKSKSYPSLDVLPDTSIVIVFHNEDWSTLLRTVHSIVNRSPRQLLREILLIDDASERDFLGEKLEEYIAKMAVPVRLERMGKRSGLIRARLKGAGLARGAVITFLDAHCECTDGWLQPILNEIHKNRKTIACPIIDVISDETFEYIQGSDMTWGGFNWKLNFRWYPVPQRELDRRRGDRSLPLRTPTMAGGLFSIDKNFFYEMGSYDSGMDIWGGENLEMSFRTWMCHGTLLIMPCSHVGHVFRKATPYTFPGGTVKILNHNNARLAAVWMDEWQEFYHKINPNAKSVDPGDVSLRRRLRQKLQCHSFRWYLENIYPESQMPLDYISLGEIRNLGTGQCLDSMGRKSGEIIGLVTCHSMGGNQIFSYTKKKTLQSDDLCMDVAQVDGPVKLFTCHGQGGNQLWEYDDKTSQLRHVNSNKCLDKALPASRNTPSVGHCDDRISQKWMLGERGIDRNKA